jgi:hypothetical protein
MHGINHPEYTRSVQALENEIASLKSSWSWRFTRPFRLLRDMFESNSHWLIGGLGRRLRTWKAKRTREKLLRSVGEFLPNSSELAQAPTYADLRYPGSGNERGPGTELKSSLCSAAFLESPAARYWAHALNLDWALHRKLWEFCFIVQALYERDMLRSGRRGLGFAVGEEPLPALFASMGCEILATDLDAQDQRATAWAETAQLATSVEKLGRPSICPDDIFQQSVSFKPVDMNNIPCNVRDFDFSWSSCSFEHCGSIDLGIQFICNQMDCLKPGGVAVHTTEFNLTSNDETILSGGTVIFRLRDVQEIIERLRAAGHTVEPLCLALGNARGDKFVDVFPYSGKTHLKLLLAERFVSTSIALIIKKSNVGS